MHPTLPRLALFLAFAAAMPSAAMAQAACDFMPLDKVNDLLAPYEPWRIAKGGSGVCQFEATERKREGRSASLMPVSLSVVQQFQASPKDAAAFVKMAHAESLKASQPVSSLGASGAGAESFMSAMPLSGMRMLTGHGHAGKAVVTVTLITPGSRLTADEEVAMFKEFMKEAVQSGARPGMAEKAGQCPQFDAALLKALLPGAPLKVRQLGSDSCMANNDGGGVVMFQRIQAPDKESLGQITESMQGDGDCKSEKLPQLGGQAALSYGCSLGNPKAEVWFVKGLARHSFSVLPGREPSAKQRADLTALAKRSFESSSGE